jgi:hypothetical protein
MNATTLNSTAIIGTTGSFTSLNASSVNMPIPSGFSGSIPSFSLPTIPSLLLPGTPSFALPTIGAARTQMPEPPSKATSIVYTGYFSTGSSGGYVSADSSVDN